MALHPGKQLSPFCALFFLIPPSSDVRGIQFDVNASSRTSITSRMNRGSYQEWLSEMAEVDPSRVEDITEGLVSISVVSRIASTDYQY